MLLKIYYKFIIFSGRHTRLERRCTDVITTSKRLYNVQFKQDIFYRVTKKLPDSEDDYKLFESVISLIDLINHFPVQMELKYIDRCMMSPSCCKIIDGYLGSNTVPSGIAKEKKRLVTSHLIQVSSIISL